MYESMPRIIASQRRPAFPSLPQDRAREALPLFSHMTAFVTEVAVLPTDCAPRYSTYRRPCWAIKESYSTVRYSINPQRPCESPQTLILISQSGFKPFSHNQGRIFALEPTKGFAPSTPDYQSAALLFELHRKPF